MHPAQLLNVKQEVLSSDLKILKPKVENILALVEEEAIEKAVHDLQLDDMTAGGT